LNCQVFLDSCSLRELFFLQDVPDMEADILLCNSGRPELHAVVMIWFCLSRIRFVCHCANHG
jgi:hypothetical protein